MALKAAGGFAGVLVVGVAIASIWMNPVVTLSGLTRPVESIGTESCITESSLREYVSVAARQASSHQPTEPPPDAEMVLHEPSGYLYLSCSDPISRTKWTPALDVRNQAKSGLETDFFAVVDTSVPLSLASYKRIKISNLPTSNPKWRGLNLVGLDVVESTIEPNVLWVYVINHRPPPPPASAEKDGVDSSVEIFRTKVGSDTFEYVRTVEDPQHIVTPNDVIGKSDGSGFWVSNDHASRVGLRRQFELYFVMEGLGIAFCSTQARCKWAINGLPSINGIARDPRPPSTGVKGQDAFYAAGYGTNGNIFVMEHQADDSLVLVDTVKMGYSLDNIQVNSDGEVYIAAFSRPLDWVLGYMADPTTYITPAAVLRVTTDPMSFYGDKYKVRKIFENNGTIISGATTAVWDKKHSLLLSKYGASFV